MTNYPWIDHIGPNGDGYGWVKNLEPDQSRHGRAAMFLHLLQQLESGGILFAASEQPEANQQIYMAIHGPLNSLWINM